MVLHLQNLLSSPFARGAERLPKVLDQSREVFDMPSEQVICPLPLAVSEMFAISNGGEERVETLQEINAGM